MVRHLGNLWRDPSTSSVHLAPHVVITMWWTAFPMLHFTSPQGSFSDSVLILPRRREGNQGPGVHLCLLVVSAHSQTPHYSQVIHSYTWTLTHLLDACLYQACLLSLVYILRLPPDSCWWKEHFNFMRHEIGGGVVKCSAFERNSIISLTSNFQVAELLDLKYGCGIPKAVSLDILGESSSLSTHPDFCWCCTSTFSLLKMFF